jgi:hypothetical protein
MSSTLSFRPLVSEVEIPAVTKKPEGRLPTFIMVLPVQDFIVLLGKDTASRPHLSMGLIEAIG